MQQRWRNRKKSMPEWRPGESIAFDMVRHSSEKNRNFFIAFIALLTYVVVAVSSTTDLDFLLPEATLRLPILAVEVPIRLFFALTPLFVVALHWDLLFNLVMHHKKLIAWRDAAGQLKPEQIQPFLFDFAMLLSVRGLAASTGFSGWSRLLINGLARLLVFWFAPLTLSFTAWWFSAYQSWEFAIWHSVLVLGDIAVILLAGNQLRSNDSMTPRATFWSNAGAFFAALACTSPTIAVSFALLALETDAGLRHWLAISLDSDGSKALFDLPTTRLIDYDADREEGSDSDAYYDYGHYTSDVYFPRVLYNWGTSDSIFENFSLKPDLKRGYFNNFPRRIDVSHTPELRRIPSDAIKLRQMEDSLSESDAWHEIGKFGQSIDLRNRRLRFAKLEGVQLRYADMTNARLDGAILHRVRLDHTKLHYATFRHVAGNDSTFNGANGIGADLSYADLSNSQWHGASMEQSTFIRANLSGARFIQTDVTNSDFRGVIAHYSLFLGSNLRWSKFDSASAVEASFSNSDLRRSSFFRAYLYRSRFHGANIANANFRLSLVQASSWGAAQGLAEAEGFEDSYATPGKFFVFKNAVDQLDPLAVVHLLRSSRIDIRNLHDKLVCDSNPKTGRAPIFARASGRSDISVKEAKCPVQRKRVSVVRYRVDAPSYAMNLANSLCNRNYEEVGHHVNSTDFDIWVLRWLSSTFFHRGRSGEEFRHLRPHFSSSAFVQRMQQPECSDLRLQVNSISEREELRLWLNAGDQAVSASR